MDIQNSIDTWQEDTRCRLDNHRKTQQEKKECIQGDRENWVGWPSGTGISRHLVWLKILGTVQNREAYFIMALNESVFVIDIIPNYLKQITMWGKAAFDHHCLVQQVISWKVQTNTEKVMINDTEMCTTYFDLRRWWSTKLVNFYLGLQWALSQDNTLK